MRRQTGRRATTLAALATALVGAAVVATTGTAAGAPTTPPPTTSSTGTTSPPPTPPTGTPTSPATGTTTATPTATPTSSPTDTGPASKGVPATFTGRLTELRTQATTLQADLTAKQTVAVKAIATYTATTRQVQAALATASKAQSELATANEDLDAARTQLQVLARDTYVDRIPHTSSALLLTENVGDLDFAVAALGFLASRNEDVYTRFTAAKSAAEAFAATQQDAVDRSRTLQTKADTQRATALTALGEVQTQHGVFLAAVTALRDDAAKAAGAAPLSAADTKAYQTFLTELNALAGSGGPVGTGTGTTYVAGGPGLTPLPGTSWVKPLVKYTVASCYCARWGTFHHGVDLSAPLGTPIYAVGAGTVVAAGPSQGFGNWVVVDHHDGSFSIYGHMRVLATVVGKQVEPGTLIAYVGSEGESTGPHLHFEVRTGSYASAATSTDPVLWLAQRGVTL
ncbi:peptidoglycan DD-metalloendopeptidase family protein [Jatrophihabitans sp. YIM 134969]